jgi:hypothetical protein
MGFRQSGGAYLIAACVLRYLWHVPPAEQQQHRKRINNKRAELFKKKALLSGGAFCFKVFGLDPGHSGSLPKPEIFPGSERNQLHLKRQ